nr:type IV secretory system conjugative DNA transfer family protein [Streptomyces ochraceiscleroticus]
MPDSLLVGVLAFLLGLTVLVWLATGLSGLFAHGNWPDRLSFTRTPLAMRELVAQPHNVPAAWPDTPDGQLSGYGLFWGVFISELMVLVVLTVFALGTITRFRTVRAERRANRRAQEAVPPATPAAPAAVPAEAAAAPASTSAVSASATAVDGRTTGAEAPAVPASVPAPQPSPDARNSVPTGVTANAPAGVPMDVPASTVASAVTEPPALPRVHYHHRSDRPAARAAALAAITAAEGPLLVATTDPTLWAESKDARAKLGPLHAYDPLHLLDTPARLRWSPIAGCEDIAAAGSRASALLAPVRPMSTLDSALADAAETLLRCWLHAAAVDGRPFRQIHRWAQGSGTAHEPVRILRTNSKAAAGRAGELESVLTAHPERRDIAQQLVVRALAALSSVHIRDACNPGRADALALDSFVAEGGTLYVVGESIEDPRTAPGAMPLLTALVSSVVERGRRMAERSSDGRLDPPLTLVLDDIAALAPIPALPALLESGAAQGLLTLATLRSPEQARTRWPHAAFPA